MSHKLNQMQLRKTWAVSLSLLKYRLASVSVQFTAVYCNPKKTTPVIFSASFSCNEQDKLKQVYIAWRRERQMIHRFSATLYTVDLRNVCPSSLLDEDPNKMTWLTNNVCVLKIILCLLYTFLLRSQYMTLHTVHYSSYFIHTLKLHSSHFLYNKVHVKQY